MFSASPSPLQSQRAGSIARAACMTRQAMQPAEAEHSAAPPPASRFPAGQEVLLPVGQDTRTIASGAHNCHSDVKLFVCPKQAKNVSSCSGFSLTLSAPSQSCKFSAQEPTALGESGAGETAQDTPQGLHGDGETGVAETGMATSREMNLMCLSKQLLAHRSGSWQGFWRPEAG